MKSDRTKVVSFAALTGLLIFTIFSSPFLHPRYPSTLQGYYAQELDWKSCYGDYQCAELLAPIDYEKLSMGTFMISLLRFRTTGNNKLGSIVVNPGGPGSLGVDYAYAAGYIFSSNILE